MPVITDLPNPLGAPVAAYVAVNGPCKDSSVLSFPHLSQPPELSGQQGASCRVHRWAWALRQISELRRPRSPPVYLKPVLERKVHQSVWEWPMANKPLVPLEQEAQPLMEENNHCINQHKLGYTAVKKKPQTSSNLMQGWVLFHSQRSQGICSPGQLSSLQGWSK